VVALADSARAAPVCAAVGVRKHYGGVQALAGVDFAVHPGQVHALVGENGAGKSTLMKVLAGAERPDAGEVRVHGAPRRFANVRQAAEAGVAIVFQELSLYPDLDVLANLFLGREPRRAWVVRRAAMEREARPVLEAMGLDVRLDRPVAALSLGERQLVEIAKALLARSDVLILDEPNSALNAAESERLFAVVRRLRDQGVAVLYVSHRLEEVFRIADVITVLRNGRLVASAAAGATTIREVVEAMLGRPPEERAARPAPPSGRPPALRLEQVSVAGALQAVTLSARPGEILGLAGLEGAGVRCVFDLLSGILRPDAGTVVLPDGGGSPRSVAAAVRRGVARVPADRRVDGVALAQSIEDNLVQVTAGALGRQGFRLRRRALGEAAREGMAALRIRAPSAAVPVEHLSGGNQQKVVLGKWLAADPRLFLFDDPTRGVDVGAKAEIYAILAAAAERGAVALFSSSELPEYAALCRRVLVFYGGRLCGELRGARVTEHRLLEAINTGRLA